MKTRQIPRRSGGHTIMEMLAALAVLSVVLAMVSQLAMLSTTLQARSEMRRQAAQEASNFLERATARPYQEITESSLASLLQSWDSSSIELSATVRDLPGANDAVVAKEVRVVARSQQVPGIRCELFGFKHGAREEQRP